jgi:hypothetical protein
LWVSVAEIAYDCLACLRVQVGDCPRARSDAVATAYTCLIVHEHSSCARVNGEGFGRTRFHAWVVVALCTEMRYLETWKWHEDSDTGGFRPYASLVPHAAGYLTSPAPGAFDIVSCYPDGTAHAVTTLSDSTDL